ncbi:serine/threonine-protein kinase [Pseudomonas fluorescens]|uniref:Serine/threonine-protein kinase PknD n=1 Tax=Pseudomonas fluorescens TaxID=294 RepID=A0A5E6ZJ24_PSEFL|nr:serine/threonine-protein kinase [Pseudomonas fluorescens]VVN66328.1 Serine/threonine-protein kinase PknD [Pseudomonas fluorescens]
MISPGNIIAGRYEVLRHVGRGGMQEVYCARDLLLEIDVALKTPQPGQVARRFKNSAIIAAKVNHHNVAKTFDYVEDGECVYLIEEFVDGETLEEKLVRFGCLDPHLGAHVLHHLAKGIQASHRVGVIHRDLKPSNVMVSRGVNLQNLKITDFGIATLTAEVFDEAHNRGDLTNSTSGTIKGALPFMAPEMMFKKPGELSGSPADIWSLGAMMFRLLTGEYPFGLYLEAAVNVKTQNRKEWPLFMTNKAQFRPLSLELQKIINSCLNYDPVARPTAESLALSCRELCYLAVDREEGTVDKLIQHGYSGFASTVNKTVFFSMESAYGPTRPNEADNNHICFSSFPGAPNERAHPVLVIKP